ncbi:hypothetical protein GCM10023224_08610 [Streptomonospora halophila]|uniref:Uncharacterized protein n=1 Tax=Streptomonospora halophila TaxID=427369 RepID=A0ABP9G6Y8_9ACTN
MSGVPLAPYPVSVPSNALPGALVAGAVRRRASAGTVAIPNIDRLSGEVAQALGGRDDGLRVQPVVGVAAAGFGLDESRPAQQPQVVADGRLPGAGVLVKWQVRICSVASSRTIRIRSGRTPLRLRSDTLFQ